jgi:hypothetical protein
MAMALSDAERRRYARHLLLPEIASSGQERLRASRVHVASGADPETSRIVRDYLARAGVTNGDERLELALPGTSDIQALAGEPLLVEAARALIGALAAVEAVKAILELGSPLKGAPPKLSSEDV